MGLGGTLVIFRYRIIDIEDPGKEVGENGIREGFLGF